MRLLKTQLSSFSFASLPLATLLSMFKLIFFFLALVALVQADPLARRAARSCTCGCTSLYYMNPPAIPLTYSASDYLQCGGCQ